ncbi:MAG TPA: hypothetical protein VHJ18_25755 [Streptosporangiaceae bacterium]|nr:hypothetical protein [Streptosporangiaceae bacterium]
MRINPLLFMSVLVARATGNWLGGTFGAVAARSRFRALYRCR